MIIDAVIRLLPGAIDAASTAEESHAEGLLEYPQFTRPAVVRGQDVPAVLTSGDHGAVRRWREREALRRTLERRPDLLVDRDSTARERRILDELAAERDEDVLTEAASRGPARRTPCYTPAGRRQSPRYSRRLEKRSTLRRSHEGIAA